MTEREIFKIVVRLQAITSKAVNKWEATDPSLSYEKHLEKRLEIKENQFNILFDGLMKYTQELIKEMENEQIQSKD